MCDTAAKFEDGDRVSHQVKGLGTVRKDPSAEDLVVPAQEAKETDPDLVYVVWDDDRFPVGRVPAGELDALPPAAEAISTGV